MTSVQSTSYLPRCEDSFYIIRLRITRSVLITPLSSAPQSTRRDEQRRHTERQQTNEELVSLERYIYTHMRTYPSPIRRPVGIQFMRWALSEASAAGPGTVRQTANDVTRSLPRRCMAVCLPAWLMTDCATWPSIRPVVSHYLMMML